MEKRSQTDSCSIGLVQGDLISMINYRTNGAEGHKTHGTSRRQRESFTICFMNATVPEIGSGRVFVYCGEEGILIERNPWVSLSRIAPTRWAPNESLVASRTMPIRQPRGWAGEVVTNDASRNISDRTVQNHNNGFRFLIGLCHFS